MERNQVFFWSASYEMLLKCYFWVSYFPSKEVPRSSVDSKSWLCFPFWGKSPLVVPSGSECLATRWTINRMASIIPRAFWLGKISSSKTLISWFPVVLANFCRGFWLSPLWPSFLLAHHKCVYTVYDWIINFDTCSYPFHWIFVVTLPPGVWSCFEGLPLTTVAYCRKEIHRWINEDEHCRGDLKSL